MTSAPAGHLPIDDVVDDIRGAIAASPSLVVVAPPGAGKTTRLPLVFLDEPWCSSRKLILVEPRRLAARAAAERMATVRGERVGETVGVRSRFDTRISDRTRIEVVTEGVFTRMVLDDPGLDGVAGVIFDEFHERALEADFGLALALDVQQGLREDLKLIVMSATLDGAGVSRILPGSTCIESPGRTFPVETRYVGRGLAHAFDAHVATTVIRALGQDDGDVLVFLPGQGEIRRVQELLSERLIEADRDDVKVLPLYGSLPFADQQRAIAPNPGGVTRKVILSTALAESSLTIDGVRVVVDGGLSRVPRFDAGRGVNRLETVRVSRASADQRRGRAGRTSPGVCYRLWAEPETRARAAFDQPEILSCDLTGLVLDCAEWGVTAPNDLMWLDLPPSGLWQAARDDLEAVGALDAEGFITDAGRQTRALPMPPRLARMVLSAAAHGDDVLREAAQLAVVLVERGAGDAGASCDLSHQLDRFRTAGGKQSSRLTKLADRWAGLAAQSGGGQRLSSGCDGNSEISASAVALSKLSAGDRLAALLMMAFPDRVAMARDGQPGQYILASGRGAQIPQSDPLSRSRFVVAANLQGRAQAARIVAAAATSRSLIERMFSDRIVSDTLVRFDEDVGAVVAREVVRLGSVDLTSRSVPLVLDETVASALALGLAAGGIGALPWSKAQNQLRQRVQFLKSLGGEDACDGMPDLGDAELADTVETWLTPYLIGLSRAGEVTADVLGQALDGMLPWDAKTRIEQMTPSHFRAPTGSLVRIDYGGDRAPSVSVRVQEVFGLGVHPTVLKGAVPLTMELLSPARRPIQMTRDLPGFWTGSWADVRAEMRGRYPKHVWPEDPATAAPTSRVKPR